MSDYGICLERIENIAVVTLNRPRRLNAFDERMFNELARITEELARKLPRAIVITGTEKSAFSAGHDVNPDNPQSAKFAASMKDRDEGPTDTVIGYVRKTVDGFVSLPVPIIAAVNGAAYGGGAELATRCDLRVMDPDAVICFSEVKLGLMPDWGGGPTLTRLIGSAKAAELILTARKVSANEALGLGLINRISASGKVLEESMSLAGAIAGNGPRAVRSALQVIRKSLDLPLAEALQLEKRNAVSLITSGECIHGVAAFLEKRIPEFPDID
ncbi:MAG: enoyl-CoA hydratase/isomerase family protein [Proteobacteria bacterium]|nr:enoyl-CoA hydratase/isomerase family protein [Pseudomonadota bacterium]